MLPEAELEGVGEGVPVAVVVVLATAAVETTGVDVAVGPTGEGEPETLPVGLMGDEGTEAVGTTAEGAAVSIGTLGPE